jgi:dolichol-phosphate mannosyltransferase
VKEESQALTARPSSADVLIVIPAYNEQGKIGNVLKKIPAGMAREIIVVDDCSSDDTAGEAESLGAVVIRHQRNRGVGASIRTGLDYALAGGHAVVAILSGDDQHDPSDLPGLLAPILAGTHDFVQGSRRIAGLDAPNIGWFRRVSTFAYAVIFRFATGFPCTDATNGGRAIRVKILRDPAIDLWQDWLNTYELEPYLLYKAIKQGYRITEAPMKVIYHDRGTTKMKPLRDWWRILRPTVFLALGIRR